MYQYDRTYETVDVHGDVRVTDVRFVYNVYWGRQAVMPSLKKEIGDPEEAPQISLIRIDVDKSEAPGGDQWFRADPDEYGVFEIWAESFHDEMLEHARFYSDAN